VAEAFRSAASAGALDLYPGAVLQVDASRRITAANRAACLLTGFRPDVLVGADCAAVLGVRYAAGGPVWSDGWDSGARLASVRGISEQALTLRRRDGSDLAVAVAGTYLRDGAGRLTGAVLALRPAARRSAGPSAIEVISTVSHELRSPLTSVKGYTSLMLNRWDRLSSDQKRMMLEQVNHDADRVVRLITELLDISRLETGRLVLRRQLVELSELAARVVAKVSMEYPDLDAELTFGAAVPKVYADPDKLEQVLTNLVENACKYASPKGLSIEGSVDGAGTVHVVVTDSGDGIPSEDLPKVFTKFFRRSEGRPTGSGLGLWISRGLVEAHDGSLTASSSPGRGASFRFTIPAVDLEELQAP
jgi:signal transduction histidine kinase